MCFVRHAVPRFLRRWWQGNQELCRRLADAFECLIISQHTGLSVVTRPVQMPQPKSTELCIGREPFGHFQPIHEHPSVMIGCKPRRFVEALGMMDSGTGTCSQKPQYLPLRDALMMFSPLSLPQMSGKISGKRRRKQKQGAKTFENNSILGAPKVAERLPVRDLISLNMYKAWFTSENIELVGVPKILDRVNFDIVPICLRQCRELCIEMGDLSETQTFLLIIETAKVPQNLLKAWIVTEHL